jgi:hypothetical protein
MLPRMVIVLPHLIRRVRISLPLVPALLDGRRYFRPDDPLLPPAAGEKLQPPRIAQASTPPDYKVWFGGARSDHRGKRNPSHPDSTASPKTDLRRTCQN